MSATARRALVKAAAGTGKTVRLTRRYLELLCEGVAVEEIIAITFTRRAAAELKERISHVLLALLDDGGERSARAQLALGAELDECYRDVAPTDTRVIRRALSGLSAAPMGTIDSFVQRLLSEFALDAVLPGPNGVPIALDFPLAQSSDAGGVFTDAARQVLRPTDDSPLSPGVQRLLSHYSLSQLIGLCMQRVPSGSPTPSSQVALFAFFAESLAEQLSAQRPGEDLRAELRQYLGLIRDLDRLEARVAAVVDSKGKPAADAVGAWLRSGDEDHPPTELITVMAKLSKGADSLGARIRGLGTISTAERLAQFCAENGVGDVSVWLMGLASGHSDPAGWGTAIEPGCNKNGKPTIPAMVDWLVAGGDPQDPPDELNTFMNNLGVGVWKNVGVDKGAWKGLTDSAQAICRRIRSRAEVTSAREFLRDMLEPEIPVAEWGPHLARQTNTAGKSAATEVAAWLASTEGGPAPAGLVPYIGNLVKNTKADLLGHFLGRDEAGQPSREVEFEVGIGGGQVRLRLSHIAVNCPSHMMSDAVGQEVERLRADLDTLLRDVNHIALQQIAREGRLSYDDLLSAAVCLAETAAGDPDHPIRSRFSALLVDEVQDSSPAQVTFYERLLALNDEMRAFFVGDLRQSIYLFRGAEPNGIQRIAALCDDTGEQLLDNYRSVGELVTAQRSLFDDRLHQVMVDAGIAPLDSLAQLKSGKGDAGLSAPPIKLVLPPPDHKVTPGDANQCALRVFADRVTADWARHRASVKDGHDIPIADAPTAVVLTPTWRTAAWAVELLRGWLGDANAVHLDGGSLWRKSRVVRDVRTLLAAFADRSNQVAWLGVWKLPMVGLSDGALALIRRGEGFLGADDTPWVRSLGWAVDASGLDPAKHEAADVRAFAVARDALRTAAADMGRRPSAEVLERLATDLRWRDRLDAAPQDDALAHLDLVLEWIRSLDAAGQPPAEIVAHLDADEKQADPPRLELTRPPLHISCMTIFQAKGLQWNHVAVMSPGVSPSGGRDGRKGPEMQPGAVEISLGEGDDSATTHRLLPIQMDPHGAFEPAHDAVAHLKGAIATRRKLAEDLRLAYVAITRATRSVTLGLPNDREKGVQVMLRDAWDRSDDPDAAPLQGVEIVPWFEVEPPGAPPLGHVVTAGEWRAVPEAGPLWVKQAPSGVGNALTAPERKRRARAIAEQILDEDGWDVGPGAIVPRDTLPDDRISPATLGTITHGWFAVWQFEGAADRAAVARYLAADWALLSDCHAPLTDFLVETCQRLSSHNASPLWQAVTRPGIERYFEMPLLGLAQMDPTADLFLLGGRIDLLIRDPAAPAKTRWSVIDFKAGNHHPERATGEREAEIQALMSGANLRSYGAQLAAYRAAVNQALAASGRDEGVGETALWFVRAGTSVRWSGVTL